MCTKLQVKLPVLLNCLAYRTQRMHKEVTQVKLMVISHHLYTAFDREGTVMTLSLIHI